MRRKNVIWAVVLIIAVIIAAIAVFAVVRQSSHIDNDQEHHENQADINGKGHHYEGNSSHHDEELSNMEPSGTLEDDRRVAKIRAQQSN